MRQFSTVTRYFRKYKHYLVLGGVAVVFANGLALVLPFIVKLIFDGLEAGVASARILQYVLLMLAAAVLAGVFRFMMRRTIIWMSRHIEFDLRGELFGHLLRLSPTYYHETRTGDIMARMTNDLEAVRQMIGPGVMYIANAVVNLTIGFSVMIYLSPWLTLVAAIPLVVLPISVNRVGNLMHRRSMKIQEHFANLTAAAQENIAGIRVVKAYRQEKGETAAFDAMSKKYISLNMDLARLYGMFFPLMRLTAGLSTLMVFLFGGMEVINGSISLGTMVAFFAYLAVLMWPVIALGWVLSLYQRGVASLARINRILFTEPRIKNKAAEPSRENIRGRIELRNLRFQYDGHRVLDGIDLVIEPGQTVGIVGQTASGKTTLVSLLARLYPVDRGQIFIDDIDINDWDVKALRKQIGFATQEVFLFSDTILENIRFGRQQADERLVEEAARSAALAKDVEGFRDSYNTIVGERGITLSGGQKQRTAIARAIIGEPAILILDDATSSVDTETEDQINERIKSVLEGRTAIIISHRVSAVKEADKILCLRDGRIAEQGSHDELIDLGGYYADLYQTQLLAEELEKL